MTDWIRVAISIVTWPLRAAWKLYLVSWWAFEDERSKGAGPETPGRKRPDRALKHGFATTLAATAVTGWAGVQAAHFGWIAPEQAAGGTLWALGAAWVLSLFTIRRREKKDVFANAKTAPLGLPGGAENPRKFSGRAAKFADAAKAYSTLAKAGFGRAGRLAMHAGKFGKSAFEHAAKPFTKDTAVG